MTEDGNPPQCCPLNATLRTWQTYVAPNQINKCSFSFCSIVIDIMKEIKKGSDVEGNGEKRYEHKRMELNNPPGKRH